MFVSWKTNFDGAASDGGKKISVEKFYADRLHNLMQNDKDSLVGGWSASTEYDLLYAEMLYINKGRPYYNFHDSMLAPAQRIKLDKIPVSLVDVPRHFKSVNIRFKTTVMEYTSVLASKVDNAVLLYARTQSNDVLFCQIDTDSDQSIEAYIASLPKTYCADMLYLMRYYVVTQFLADCPDENLIEYDILSKDRGEWINATPERKKQLIERARQKGKKGWNVGVSSRLLTNAPRLSKEREPGEQGRERTSAHIRTGHLHAVRCGKNKDNVKIMWFRPTVVRDDLPFKQ